MNRGEEVWAWLGGIFGAVVIGVVITLFITGDVSAYRGIGLVMTAILFGLVPILWAGDLLGGWTLNEDDTGSDE